MCFLFLAAYLPKKYLKQVQPPGMGFCETISLQDFDGYIKRAGLSFFNPKNCTDEKPYRCICIFGPPNIGKLEAATSLNSYMNGVRQATTSANFYKWTCERGNIIFFTTRTTASPAIQKVTGANYFSHSIQSSLTPREDI